MISAEMKEKLKVCLSNDSHFIMADVSEKNGGDASALDPHEILEASLAACTSITVKMYANRKNIALKDVHTVVKITKEDNENIIERKLDFIGDLTAEEKNKLLEIANKCPIHLFLERKTSIQTSMI